MSEKLRAAYLQLIREVITNVEREIMFNNRLDHLLQRLAQRNKDDK